MATVRETIVGALKLIGELAPGEEPTDDEMADALTAFNDMLDSWSAERLSVFSTQDQTFTWPANTTTRTLGPSGDFVGNRPVQLDDSTYFKQGTLSYPLVLINEDQYNSIALKSNTSTWPQVLFPNYTMPDITMKVYPVPTSDVEVHFISVEVLTETDDLDTELVIPPGYRRAFRFNLGCEIASEFGIEAPIKVQRIADVSKRVIKRINNPKDLMSTPIPTNPKLNIFNPYSGQPY